MALDIFGLTGMIKRNTTSKCLVGLLPHKPEINGFTITSSSNSETVLNVFRETDLNWRSHEASLSWIRIRCPFAIKLWSNGLHGTEENADTMYNITIRGTNDDSAFNLISAHSCRLLNEFVLLDIDNDNIPAYTMISVEFRSEARPTTSVCLKKLQLYVYNG